MVELNNFEMNRTYMVYAHVPNVGVSYPHYKIIIKFRAQLFTHGLGYYL